jgi:hypothetical protein
MSARNSASILAPTITHNQIEVTHHAGGVANYGFGGASRAGYSAGRWIKLPRHGCRTSRSWVARHDRGGLGRQSELQIFVVCQPGPVQHIEYFIENWLRQRQGVGGTRLL